VGICVGEEDSGVGWYCGGGQDEMGLREIVVPFLHQRWHLSYCAVGGSVVEPELEPECRSFGSGSRLRVSLSST
jgi:hypothetical protein